MQLPHPGVIVLVLGCAAIDILTVLAVQKDRAWPSACLLWGLMLSQNGLLWFWAALGTARFAFRLTLPGIVALTFTALRSWDGDRQVGIILLFGATAILLLMILIPMRLVGRWFLTKRDKSLLRAERVQFSLWSMMEVTTGVAVLAAFTKLTLAPSPLPPRDYALYLILSLAAAAVVLPLAWAFLRVRFLWSIFGVVIAIIVAIAVVTNAIIHEGKGETIDVILTHGALLSGYLVILRLCGYRLVRAAR